MCLLMFSRMRKERSSWRSSDQKSNTLCRGKARSTSTAACTAAHMCACGVLSQVDVREERRDEGIALAHVCVLRLMRQCASVVTARQTRANAPITAKAVFNLKKNI